MTHSIEMTSTPEMELRHRATNAGGAMNMDYDPGVPTARSPLRSTPQRAEVGGDGAGGSGDLVSPNEPEMGRGASSHIMTSPTEDEPSMETPASEPEVTPSISFWAFFTGEIKRGYALENEEDKFRQRREQVSVSSGHCCKTRS